MDKSVIVISTSCADSGLYTWNIANFAEVSVEIPPFPSSQKTNAAALWFKNQNTCYIIYYLFACADASVALLVIWYVSENS